MPSHRQIQEVPRAIARTENRGKSQGRLRNNWPDQLPATMKYHDQGHPKTATPRPWPHADSAATTAVTEPSTCMPVADEVEAVPPVVVVAFMHIGTCDQATSSIVLFIESA